MTARQGSDFLNRSPLSSHAIVHRKGRKIENGKRITQPSRCGLQPSQFLSSAFVPYTPSFLRRDTDGATRRRVGKKMKGCSTEGS